MINQLLSTLTKEQLVWVEKLLTGKKVIAVKSRRAGITFCSGVAAMLSAKYGEDTNVIATNLRTAKEFLRPWRYKALGEFDTTATTFINKKTGSRLQALPNYPEVVRGFSGNVIADEAGFIEGLEDVLTASQPLAIRGGRIALITSPSHTDHYSYQLVQSGEWDVVNFPFDEVAVGIYLTIFGKWDKHHFNLWFEECINLVQDPQTELFCQWVSTSQTDFFTNFGTTDKFNLVIDPDTPLRVDKRGWYVGVDVGFFRHPTVVCCYHPQTNSYLLIEFWHKLWENIYQNIRCILDKSEWVAFDRNGVGLVAWQELVKDFPSAVGANISQNWYRTVFENYRQKLEDGIIHIPNAPQVTLDHKKVKRVFLPNGKIQPLLTEYQWTKTPPRTRHCDWTIAIALATMKIKKPVKKFNPWAIS